MNLEDIKTPIKKIFIKKLVKFKYDGVIISVKHDKFIKFGPKYIKNLLRDDRGLIFDVKGILGKDKNIIKL